MLSPFFFTKLYLYNTGRIILGRCSYFVIMNMTSETFASFNQPTYNSRFMYRSYHYITSRLWNNLPDYVRIVPSLNIFTSMLDEVILTTGVKCNCKFCTYLDSV